MAIVLFFICIALPLLEIAVLVKVGQLIGFWSTLAILIGMALLGLWVLSRQSWSALLQAREAVVRGEPPVVPMLEGALLVLAGALLLAPGLITDAAALLLLIPPVRRAAAHGILRHFFVNADIHVAPSEAEFRGSRQRADGTGPVIEGEFERLDERPVDRKRGGNHDDRSG